MKSLTRGHLKAGIDAMRGAKVRNFWTMFGIIVGVASVITIVSIGEGIKAQISNQIHHYGKDLIVIQPQQLVNSRNGSINPLSSFSVTASLNSKDLKTVSGTHGVGATAPLSATPGTVKGDHGVYSQGLVIGTTPDLPSLINQSLAFGTFITTDDSENNVAVLGQNAADKLFNESVPLGRTFLFRGQEFIVQGIFNQFDNTPLSQDADFNSAIFIPYDVSENLTNNSAPTFEILAKPTDPKATSSVVASIEKSLKAAHGGQSDFTVLQQSQNLSTSNTVLDLITKLIAGAAAISLLVGGIGIMNVMLVSVAERMHEIGIRKAIGATNRQILSQFMIEASFLSLTGGIIGIGVAYLIDLILRLTTDLRPLISWQIVLIATGVSLSIGIIFGTVPALKAARKDPIEALRAD